MQETQAAGTTVNTRKFMEADDDQGGCFGVLLRENPYSTKAAENVTGR